MYLDYVFDISDTHSNNIPVTLWQYQSRFDGAIIETLENSFGELSSKDNIASAVISAAENAIDDSKADYLAELKYAKENSFLEDLDELNIDVEFKQTAETSVAYMILHRLGLNPDIFFEREDFPHIMNFNTPQTLSVLGSCISSIAEDALRSISDTIRAEIKNERTKIFAEKENTVYNENKEDVTPRENNERTENYDRNENSLHGSERVSVPELDSTETDGRDRKIRTEAEEIPQEPPTEPVFEPDDNGQDNRAFAGSGNGSETADRADSDENSTDGGHHGGTESQRPAVVDGNDELGFTFSGGNRTAGSGLQLSLFDTILTEDEQKDVVQKAAQEFFGAAFAMPGQIIDEVLCDGSNEKDSIIEICIEFSKDKSIEKKAEFLKNLYKTDGKGFVFDGRKVSAWWNEEGIRISYGESANTNTAQLISWENAAKRIDELLDLGRFAPKETLLRMTDYEYEKVANKFIDLNRNLNDEDYPELNAIVKKEWLDGVFPDKVERMAKLLKTAQGLDEIKTVTQKLCDMYEENADIVYYKYNDPNITNDMLADLYITRKNFSANALTYTPPERFISSDEVDKLFRRGSNVSESKYRIYTFFDTHSDKKERIDFLKHEYGIGGSYNGIYNEEHDSKGISFSHGDLTKPYAKEAEKRIDKLIKSRSYLNEAEIKNIPNYEKEQLANTIKSAYWYDLSEDIITPYPSGTEYTTATKIITEKLNDTTQTETMLYDLKELFAQTPHDARSYPYREKAVQDLEKYVNGEYNLFPNIERIEEIKEETTAEKLSQMSDEEKDAHIGYVEINLDYSSNDLLTDEDMELYHAIIKEKSKSKEQTFEEYLSELHKDDNGSKTIALLPLGDFYESYGEDAENAARVLDIHPLNKEIEGKTYLMCGFPKHILEDYTNKLLYAGFDVVLADEDKSYKRILSADKVVSQEKAETIAETENTAYNSDNLIGKEIELDERKFVVDSVNADFNEVSLKDITFQNSTGFPIFRNESLDFVKNIVSEQEKPQITAEFQKAKPTKVQNTVVFPEISLADRRNFVIENDELGYGTASEKFEANVSAIRMLKTLESEKRLATADEQEVLSKYVGWGGLADCFEEKHSKYQELKSLLTDTEYEQARVSTLTAHFTPPVVIKAMYKALGNMGFSQGNILDITVA